jgi:hypothetical protein
MSGLSVKKARSAVAAGNDGDDDDGDDVDSIEWDSFPVQMMPEPNTEEESASLPVGGALRAVSGWDVYQPKAAATTTRLWILPGLLSLHNDTTPSPPSPVPEPPPLTNGAESAAVKNGATTPSKEPEVSRTSSATAAKRGTGGSGGRLRGAVLGRVQGMLGNRPTLTLSSESTVVQFSGRTMETQSTFVALRIVPPRASSRKSSSGTPQSKPQRVQCLGTFRRVTAFGPLHVVTRSSTEPSLNRDDTVSSTETKDDAWNHYGGSTRTVDGSMASHGQTSTTTATTRPTRRRDNAVHDDSSPNDDDDEHVEQEENEAISPPPSHHRRVQPQRQSRRPRASLASRSDDDESTEHSESNADEDSNDDYRPTATGTPPRRRTTTRLEPRTGHSAAPSDDNDEGGDDDSPQSVAPETMAAPLVAVVAKSRAKNGHGDDDTSGDPLEHGGHKLAPDTTGAAIPTTSAPSKAQAMSAPESNAVHSETTLVQLAPHCNSPARSVARSHRCDAKKSVESLVQVALGENGSDDPTSPGVSMTNPAPSAKKARLSLHPMPPSCLESIGSGRTRLRKGVRHSQPLGSQSQPLGSPASATKEHTARNTTLTPPTPQRRRRRTPIKTNARNEGMDVNDDEFAFLGGED